MPHNVVDHTHATSFLALANLPDPRAVVREIFDDDIAIVPYIMPGFRLAKIAAEVADNSPEAEGLLLLQHGHFTWGKDAKESYNRVIDHTRRVEAWFEDQRDEMQYPSIKLPKAEIHSLINDLKIVINKASRKPNTSYIFNVIDDPNIITQIGRHIASGVTDRGVATPDHVIRLKGKPWVLTCEVQASGVEAIAQSLKDFIDEYKQYFQKWSVLVDSPKTMLDPMPKLVWVQGMGLIGIGKSMKEAKTITDLGAQNVRVIGDCEMVDGFYPVGDRDLFDMEYWSLEQAKLSKPSSLPFQGKVVAVTGAGGAIGAAIVKTFEKAGAEVVAIDINPDALAQQNFSSAVLLKQLDLTDENQINTLIHDLVQHYGGVDILVSNAGTASQAPLLEISLDSLRDSFEINFFAHFYLAKAIGQLFVAQGNEGQMLFNISKQAVNPGRNFGAYGLPKATLMFLVKQLALELGEHGIRVNGVNADRIRSGILNANMIANRAKARANTIDEYMTGNLLKKEVHPQHVAEAFFNLALSRRTTGHVMTVDGGNIEASLR